MFSDEYYSNPVNTQNKCKHNIPLKWECDVCISELALRKEIKDIKIKINELENKLIKILDTFCH